MQPQTIYAHPPKLCGKVPIPAMTDDELTRLIRDNSPPPEFPASFQRQVWQRIAAFESKTFGATLEHFAATYLTWLSRPAIAVAVAVTIVVFGAGLGGIASERKNEDALKNAYAASINPFIAAHATEK